MNTSGHVDRTLSLGIWTWLAIVESESETLSLGAQVALESLRADLTVLARGLADRTPTS